MNSNYIYLLYKHYCNSVGKKYDIANILVDKEFILYLSLLKNNMVSYGQYLCDLGVSLNSDSVIELDSGKYDSFGPKLVTIVSQFADTLGYKNSELLISGEKPFVLMGSSTFCVDNCNMFIAQNPLVKKTENDIVRLQNIGKDICMGVYGKIYDKDKTIKLKMLKENVSRMSDGVDFYYDTDKDNYFGCIKSESILKIKKLTKRF